MKKNRRQRTQPDEHWCQEQQDSWRWDSHMWDLAEHRYVCQWCGWNPPEGIPLSEVSLCMKNPAITALVDKITTGMGQVFEKMGLGGGEKHGK